MLRNIHFFACVLLITSQWSYRALAQCNNATPDASQTGRGSITRSRQLCGDTSNVHSTNGGDATLPMEGFTAGLMPFKATGGNTARTMADRAADMLNVLDTGAKCDGSTNDSAAFTFALSASRSVFVPQNRVCVVGNLTLMGVHTLNVNNSVLKAAEGASWLVKLTGYHPILQNAQIEDTAHNLLRTTKLTASAAPGATTLSVASTLDLVADSLVQVALANGFHTIARVSSVRGNTITIEHGLDSYVNSGALVQTSQGGILVDVSSYATVENIISNDLAIPISIQNSTKAAGGDTREPILSEITASGAIIAGIYLGVAVNTGHYQRIHISGNGPTFGGVGLYQDGDHTTYVSGGHNFYDFLSLGTEDGAILNDADLSSYISLVLDGMKNRTLVIRDSRYGALTFTDYWSGVTPNGVTITNSGRVKFNSLWSSGATNYDLSVDKSSDVSVVDEGFGPGRRTIGAYNRLHTTSIGGSPLDEVLRISPVAIAEPSGAEINNKWELRDSLPGGSPTLNTIGPDANVNMHYNTKGNGGIYFSKDGGATFLGGFDGSGLVSTVPYANQASDYEQPTSGGILSPTAKINTLIIDPKGPISNLTVMLPSVFRDGQVFSLVCGQTITTLTINLQPSRVRRFPSSQTCSPSQGHEFLYRAAGAVWFQRY